MNRLAWLAVFIALAHFLAAEAGAQESAASADAREGQRLALKICTACHLVSPDQPYQPVLRPPASSFAAIANRPATSAQSLRKFLLTTHATLQTPSNMPNPQLTDDQAAAVVSYILSLKKRD
jgi:cytochrome c